MKNSMLNILNKFSSFNTLVITGAGFSKDAGLPLEKDVIPNALKLFRKNNPEIIKTIEAKAKNIFKIKNIFKLSIEEILTRIKLEELFAKPKRDYVKEIQPFENSILDLFCQTLILQSSIPQMYFDFVKLHRDKTAYATLNNDLLLELVFTKLQSYWSYVIENDATIYLGKKDYYYKSFELHLHSKLLDIIPYLKLHGSFNWHYCWRCDTARITSFDKFYASGTRVSPSLPVGELCDRVECLQKGSGQAMFTPLIIPPTLIKYYDLKFIQFLWTIYQEIVRSVERIIVIGTSLRDEDILFLNSINHLSMKNRKIKEVIFINPEKDIIKKIESLIGFKVTYFRYMQDYLGSVK